MTENNNKHLHVYRIQSIWAVKIAKKKKLLKVILPWGSLHCRLISDEFYRLTTSGLSGRWEGVLLIECFHMTSRRPKTMKRRPCWCPKPVLWELNSFLMQTLSFVSINLHRCWPREWKHSWEVSLYCFCFVCIERKMLGRNAWRTPNKVCVGG